MAATIFRPGATALITGGASGVGFAMATLFRQHGMHICLIDNNSTHLSAALASLKSQSSTSVHPGIKTTSFTLDVADQAAWSRLKPEILSHHPSIDVLMLNAGTSLKPDPSASQTYDDATFFTKTLATNTFGVVNGLATFLGTVQQTARQHKGSPTGNAHTQAIIITGSKQGITNPPGANNPAYNMSKAALKSLAEHLAHDLRTPTHSSFTPNLSVHLLIPGWTFTGLSGNPGPTSSSTTTPKQPTGSWLPAQVASYAMEKITKDNAFYIVCPDDDVDEALDQARMAWAAGDVIEGRPALSRWEDGWKDEAARKIGEDAERRRQQGNK